ncbi:UNVERIFIED_CONTAM: Transcription factor UPBEAT1 [Sesamum latifolium]|uniref:Transcription factor UPBEAT1 n=1 Tax=Sesamum latifolium TaxID=2727402 RepID=A0AAW2Y266_9LAMI
MGMGGPANAQQLLSSLIKQNPDFWRKLSLERRRRRPPLIRHYYYYSSSSSSNGISSSRYYYGTTSIVMKRRARLDRCIIRPHRPNIIIHAGVERKLRILKKLIPNSETMGTESVLRETADYILALQMRVQVMKIMVDVLSSASHDDEDY